MTTFEELLSRQHRAFTTSQATALGVDKHSICRRVDAGYWTRPHRGVVIADRRGDDLAMTTAALLSCGWPRRPAALCGPSALWLHGLAGLLGPRSGPGLLLPVTVALPHQQPRAAPRDLVRAYRLPYERLVVTERRQLPVVSVDDALVDLFPLLFGRRARAAVLAAVQQRRTTVERLQACLQNRGTPECVGELREALNDVLAAAESLLEVAAQVICRDGGIRPPTWQLTLDLGNGLWHRFDGGWMPEMVLLEVDGVAYHSSEEERERDIAIDAAVAAMGGVVIRTTNRQMRSSPGLLVRNIHSALAVRAHRN